MRYEFREANSLTSGDSRSLQRDLSKVDAALVSCHCFIKFSALKPPTVPNVSSPGVLEYTLYLGTPMSDHVLSRCAVFQCSYRKIGL